MAQQRRLTLQQGSGTGRTGGWSHPLAFGSALLIFVMIVAGATVTTIGAGDSDPAWSWRFWEWFRSASGGQFYELLHRQIGTVIGFVAIGMVVSLFRNEERRWVRRLGVVALLMIIVQGLLGGLRVQAVSSPAWRDFLCNLLGIGHEGVRMTLAMVHAFNAQLVFCTLVALAVVTSRGWRGGEQPSETSEHTRKTRRLAMWACALIFVQLVLGAYVRHGRVLYPGETAPYYNLVLLLHVCMALGVVGHIFLVNSHTRASHPKIFPVWHLAGLAQFLGMFQLALGAGAWAVTQSGVTPVPWDVAMLVRVLHVGNGAAIFAIFVTLGARSFKLLRLGAPEQAGLPQGGRRTHEVASKHRNRP